MDAIVAHRRDSGREASHLARARANDSAQSTICLPSSVSTATHPRVMDESPATSIHSTASPSESASATALRAAATSSGWAHTRRRRARRDRVSACDTNEFRTIASTVTALPITPSATSKASVASALWDVANTWSKRAREASSHATIEDSRAARARAVTSIAVRTSAARTRVNPPAPVLIARSVRQPARCMRPRARSYAPPGSPSAARPYQESHAAPAHPTDRTTRSKWENDQGCDAPR